MKCADCGMGLKDSVCKNVACPARSGKADITKGCSITSLPFEQVDLHRRYDIFNSGTMVVAQIIAPKGLMAWIIEEGTILVVVSGVIKLWINDAEKVLIRGEVIVVSGRTRLYDVESIELATVLFIKEKSVKPRAKRR